MKRGKIITTLGERIKYLRRKKKLTLADMAEMSNLSAGYLSQIEQDKKTPSLVAFTSIAEVLEINPRDLLEPEKDQVYITRAADRLANSNTNASIFQVPLTSVTSGSDLGAQRLILQPNAPPLEFEPHSGEIFGFVLAGALTVIIEDEQIELEAGDSIHYDANQSYRLNCQGDAPCLIIWCSSPPWHDLEAKIYQAHAKIS